MKEYQKSELEVVEFASEAVANTDVTSGEKDEF